MSAAKMAQKAAFHPSSPPCEGRWPSYGKESMWKDFPDVWAGVWPGASLFQLEDFSGTRTPLGRRKRKSPPCSSTHSIAAMWNGKTKTIRQTTASAINQNRIDPVICISMSPLCACLKKLRSAARRICNPHRCDTSGPSIYRPTGSHSLVARAGIYSSCLRILPTNLSTGLLCGNISSRPPSGPIK